MSRSAKILGVILSFCLFVTSNAAEIRGTVTDGESGEPVPGATIMIEGTYNGAGTDLKGNFEIKNISYGSHKIIISSVGYSDKTETVHLSPDQSERFQIKLHPSPLEIDGIVVTGTRTPRFVKDAPVRTQVITKSSIENKSATNIFEALDGESGVRVEEQCQGCNFSVLRMQGLGADHTQILIDGQPVYSGLASVYGLQQLSTADVDQIEIVKGAGSALYGSNAVAGAVNIISSIPKGTEGKVGIELGEYGTNKYDITASMRKDNVGIFIFGQHNEQDEIDQTGDINAPGGVENPDGWIDRIKTSSDNLGFNLYVDEFFTYDQLAIRGRVLNERRDGGWLKDNLFLNRFAPGTESIITDRYSGGLTYKVWLRNGSELNADFTMVKHRRDATNETFLADYEDTFGETPPVDLLKPYIADEQLLMGSVNYMSTPLSGHRLLAGIQVTYNKLDESGMYVDFDHTEAYQSKSEKKSFEFGAYLQDEIRITNKLELVGGIRFDYHESEDEFRGSGNVHPEGLEPLEYQETSLNPRFSAKYSVNDNLNIRASVGTGFRVPYGFSEDLHLCSGSPRVYKGGNLKPEKSVSYSINADYFYSGFSAGLNIYRTELTDAIAFVDADEAVAANGYTYKWENIDDAYVMGMECDATYSILNDLIVGVRFEIFEGKYDNSRGDWKGTEYEEMSRNVSRFPSTSAGISLDYSPSEWSFNIDVDYKGKMYIDLTEPENPDDIKIHETETFAVIDARIGRTFHEKYTLYVGAKNLNNYIQKEKHVSDAAFMYAPVYGRIIYGGIKISF